MSHMSKGDWDSHVNAINEWQEDSFQEPVIFRRNIVKISQNGEDNNVRYKDIEILGLVQYNYFRSWPVSQPTDTGEIDKESCMLYLNVEYLRRNGLTNEFNQFLFDPAEDRFIISGVNYKPAGESQVAQAHDKTILFYIILKREEIPTGTHNYLR